MNPRIIQGDCRDTLAQIEPETVQTCVTSPPYWGLRSYLPKDHPDKHLEIGQEKTPQEFVAAMLAVFGGKDNPVGVWRTLRKDGTMWLNLGDSYAANRGGTSMPAETLAGGISGHGDTVAKRGRESEFLHHRNPASHGLKHKDLIGIPWRVAFALQAAGWYLRQDIIWHKPNPMPESVTDRCTKAHEYLFLLTKSQRYYYDAEAIKELADSEPMERNRHDEGSNGDRFSPGSRVYGADGKRNKRSVWTITTNPYPEAHFATFPPDLITPCILAGSKAGDTVLDPFGGSGTTGQVTLELGRKAILCELNEEYLPLIDRRTNVTPGMCL